MNKKSFIITISVATAVLILTIVLFVVFNPLNKEKEPVTELSQYQEIFVIELVNNEYVIKELRDSKMSIVEIPNTIDSIPVTKLVDPNNDFDSFKNVSRIVIPENIKYIGNKMQEQGYGTNILIQAIGLSHIEVSENNSVYQSIDGVLYSKEGKVLLKYPNSKNFNIERLEITIPENVEKIYDHAFYRNQYINILNCNALLQEIGSYSFSGCENLNVINLNNGLEKIGNRSFDNCQALTSILIPSSVKEISYGAFRQCSSVIRITIEARDISLGDNIFTQIAQRNVLIYVTDELYSEFDRQNVDNALIKMGITPSCEFTLRSLDAE